LNKTDSRGKRRLHTSSGSRSVARYDDISCLVSPHTPSASRSVARHDDITCLVSPMKKSVSRTDSSKSRVTSASAPGDGTCLTPKQSPRAPRTSSFSPSETNRGTPKKKRSVSQNRSSSEESLSPRRTTRSHSSKRNPVKKPDSHRSRHLQSRLDYVDSVSPRKSKSLRSVSDEMDDVDDDDPIVAFSPVKGRKVTRKLASDTSSVVVAQLQLPGIDVARDTKIMVQYEDVASVMF